MGGGGSANSAPTVTQSTTTANLPAWMQQGAQDVYARMQGAADRGYQEYGGATVAGLTPDQQAAFDRVRGIQGQADPFFASTLSGLQGLGSQARLSTASDITGMAKEFMSPYTRDVTDAALRDLSDSAAVTRNGMGAQASNVGAFGGTRQAVQSGIFDAGVARQAGDLSANLAERNHTQALAAAMGLDSQNQNRAFAALGMIPTVAAGRTNLAAQEASWLQQAGNSQQNQQQAELDDAARRWQERTDYPMTSAAMLGQTLSGLPYGTTTTSDGRQQVQDMKRNKLAGAAAGAATGATIGSVVPGWGTAIGAVAGGLLGYFA